MSIDITIEEMEALPAESYELFDIRGEIERAHGILPNSTASSADVLMENPPEDKEKKIIICCSRGQISRDIAEELQDQGYDTIQANIMLGFPADMRDYTIGSQILEDLGVHELRLMTNNPEKIDGIAAFDLKIIERVPIQMKLGKNDAFYLLTKKEKMGHLLTYPMTLEEEEQAKKDNKDNK